ncbi:MAG: hypothetical protein AB8B55_24045 [Mariniblastus sp.]
MIKAAAMSFMQSISAGNFGEFAQAALSQPSGTVQHHEMGMIVRSNDMIAARRSSLYGEFAMESDLRQSNA